MKHTTIIVGAVLAAALGVSSDASGQTALQRRLAQATRIDCSFSVKITGDWDGADASAMVDITDFEASFFDINVDEGTAEADGRFGSSYIVVRYSFGYLHLMQMFNSGPLYLTTVLAQETENGRFKAVHTRHEYTPTVLPGFTSRPEMYIGDCAVES